MTRLTTADLDVLVRAVPFARDTPLAVAVSDAHGAIVEAVRGYWRDGRAVTSDNQFYGASLAKQVTGAAIALLVNRGILDPTDRLGQFMPYLPAWMGEATLLQLLGHTASFPAAGVLESRLQAAHWTTAWVLDALASSPPSIDLPASRFSYSNAGYVVLGQVVAQASGLDLASFARDELFLPLALTGIGFPPDGDVAGFPQAAGLGRELPLSHGDGGLWTTARDFACWLAAQNSDALGIGSLVETPARLSDGTLVDYGWGIGLRSYRGEPLFNHGGSWKRGACNKAVRSRALGISIAVFTASETEQDHVGALVDAILEASG